MTSKLLDKLRGSKKYRDLFVEGQIKTGIPFQIRVMRESRPWKQSELGERANMPQAVISRMEKPGGGNLTIKTLLRIASAFDVGLIVRFAPFSEVADWANGRPHITPGLSQNYLSVPSFEEDEGFAVSSNNTIIPGELDAIARRSESDEKGIMRLVYSSAAVRPQGVFPSDRPHEVPQRSTTNEDELDAINRVWTDPSVASSGVRNAR